MEEQALAPHVLALDDDAAIRDLIADYLGANDLRVTTVASGRELTDAVARTTFDVVILDLRLPGEDGMQIARRLRETSAVPILMLTGRVEEARAVMRHVHAALSPLGLLAEDYDTVSLRMWGNFPQAYSHVGLIHAAFAAAPRWEDVL